MPITYYPDSVMKKPSHVIDKLQKKRTILSVENRADLTSFGSYTLWAPFPNWMVHEVLLHFEDGTSRDFSVNKVIGRGIITNLNDKIWLRCDGFHTQDLYLTQGFYDGTSLAAEIKNKIDSNQAFIDAGVAPSTVSYDSATGLFTITANSGNIQYINRNTSVGVRRNSTASPVIGFTADSAFANSIVSDTAIFGLGNVIPILSEEDNTDLNAIINVGQLSPDFDVDAALSLVVNAVSIYMDYKITYEEYF